MNSMAENKIKFPCTIIRFHHPNGWTDRTECNDESHFIHMAKQDQRWRRNEESLDELIDSFGNVSEALEFINQWQPADAVLIALMRGETVISWRIGDNGSIAWGVESDPDLSEYACAVTMWEHDMQSVDYEPIEEESSPEKPYKIAFAGGNGGFEVVEEFEAANDNAANRYAEANYPDQEWYVLDDADDNING